MQVSVEQLQGLERRMKVTIAVEAVEKCVEACFQKVAKTVKIDGFRPGKVPRSILEERFGESIRQQEAAPQLIQDTLWEAFKQAEVEPAGRPTIEGPVVLNPKEVLNYSVLFDVFPIFEVKDLNGQEVEQIASELTEKDVDKAIEQLLEEQAQWVDITTPAEEGDKMELSYTVTIDGQPIDLEKAEHTIVELGTHPSWIIQELEEKLVGLSAGNESTIEATYPTEYAAAEVAGKKAQFAVKVHSVKRKKLPVLDDAFAKRFDNAANVEEFRKNIQSSMSYYLKTALEDINKLMLFNAMVAVNEIDLPPSLVQTELESMARSFVQSTLKKTKVSDQELNQLLPFLTKLYKKSAKKRVHLGIVIRAFAEKNPQTITDEMLEERAKERSKLYVDPEAWLEEYHRHPENKQRIQNLLWELAIADKLRESATIKTTHLDYFAVLEKERALQQPAFDEQEEEDEEGGHVHGEHCQHEHHHHHDHEEAHHHE